MSANDVTIWRILQGKCGIELRICSDIFAKFCRHLTKKYDHKSRSVTVGNTFTRCKVYYIMVRFKWTTSFGTHEDNSTICISIHWYINILNEESRLCWDITSEPSTIISKLRTFQYTLLLKITTSLCLPMQHCKLIHVILSMALKRGKVQFENITGHNICGLRQLTICLLGKQKSSALFSEYFCLSFLIKTSLGSAL